MKEKIIEILKPNLYGTIGNFKDCANKIESLYEDYYPEEFILWLDFTAPCQFYADLETNSYDDFYSVAKKGKMTLKEIYDYWLTNINSTPLEK